jgi:hypothetical protein
LPEKPDEVNEEGNLRMALQEIIRLRLDLDEADRRMSEAHASDQKIAPDILNSEVLGSIIEDLKDSTSSIAENNKTLEDVGGDLDANQRKHLERISIARSHLPSDRRANSADILTES